nr:TonB-dependent receptor [Sphingomonas sp. CDS-1]
MNRLLVKALILSATALSTGAYGQDSATPRVTAAEEGAGVGDIIVTARKRAESLRDVPVAITAISGDMLVQQNITQMIDLSKTTPNFTYSYGAANAYAYIRGFGSGSNAGFEQSVGKFVDNVSYGRDQEARIPIFDVERVEVLKGPQVIAFGNSATAGAINITTRKPGKEFSADGSIGYEFEGQELQAQMGVTVPLTDGISFRLAALFQDLNKGRYYNPIKGEHEPTTRNFAIRPTLRLEPVDGLEIMLRTEIDRLKDRGGTLVPTNQPLVGNTSLYPVIRDDDHRYANYDVAPYYSDEISELEAELYQIDVNYDVAGGTLSSTTAWRKSDGLVQWGLDGLNHTQFYFNPQWTHYKQFSQELRYNGTFGKLDVQVGGYYERNTLNLDVAQEFTLAGLGFTGAFATPFARFFTFDQKSRTWSGFVDLSYHVTDRFSLSAGVRYTDLKKRGAHSVWGGNIVPHTSFDTTRADLLAADSTAVNVVYNPVLGGERHVYPFGAMSLSENHWQPQFIAQYEVAPRNMIYAKYVKGYKVGGFDYAYTDPLKVGVSGIGFKPESAWMVELGAKGLLLDNMLEYSIAVFRETFADLQTSAQSNLQFIVTNVGKARSQGVELELHLRPDDHWHVGFNGAYLDAKYIDFDKGPCNSAQNAGLAPGCVSRAQNFAGVPTQFTSKWTGSLYVDYVTPIGSGDNELGVGLSVFARSKYDSSLYNDPRMVQKGYAQFGAHIDYGPANGRWKLSLFGRNLTDQRIVEYSSVVPGSSTSTVGSYSRGRQIGVKLGFNM